MSSKSEDLFPRGKALPSQSPLFWVSEKDRYLRQLLIRDIEEITGRSLIVYFTDCTTNAQIDANDEKYLAELIGACRSKQIDLLLETNGGYTDATEKVVSTVNHWNCELRVLVPSRAKSNGTVIALAAEKILMGPNSELGPIDPNIHMGQGQFAPAHFIMNIDPARVDPMMRQVAEYAIKQTQKLATSVLKNRMLKDKEDAQIDAIVNRLSTRDYYHSHGSVIDYSEASSLGLNVEFLQPTDELWRRVWLLRCMYEHDCRINKLVKIFEANKISSGIAAVPATATV